MDFHDPVSSWSHLFMAGWCVFTGIILLRLASRHSPAQRLSVLVFAGSAVALYTASGLFHGLRHPTPDARRAWQLLDQTAIFGLIFGSNVPLCVYLLPEPRRWRQVAAVAVVGLAGTAVLWLAPLVVGKPPHTALVVVYLLMGFLGLVPIRTYYRRIGRGGVLWIGLMAGSYVFGAVSEAVSWPTIVPGVFGYHEILHFADMLGTSAHTVLLIKYVLPTAKHRPAAAHPSVGSLLPPISVDRRGK